eukprot:15366738-Ditylum_brightwellii.AAC.1
MTRFIKLPPSERCRLEADKCENSAKIAEVVFDPTSSEWYYLTMRHEKTAPNHINKVFNTLLELSDILSAEKLRFCMSDLTGMRDAYYREDFRCIQRQLLYHQRYRLWDERISRREAKKRRMCVIAAPAFDLTLSMT